MISALNKLPDGTINLTINIPTKRVKESYQKTLAKLAQKVTIKGFRKGKAPLKRAERELGKQTIYKEVLKTLITQVYLEAVKEHQLKPIVNPQIKVVSLEEEKDWQITATTCELPKIKLKDYRSAVKAVLAPSKIWVPGKDQEKPSEENESEKMSKVFKVLLKSVEISLPGILVEEEVNRMLSRLIDQTKGLGLSIEQYLASVEKTSDQLRQEYRQQADETLRLELILSKIADEEKIQVKDDEVEKMIEAVPEEKTKKSLRSPAQRAYIRQLLRKRTVIDKLSKL